MKKNMLILIFTMVLSFSPCYASDLNSFEPVEPIIPAYVAVDSVISNIAITGGTAVYYTKASSSTSTSVTKIVATIRLLNSKGTVVKTKTDTIKPINWLSKISDSKKLTSRGSYYVKTTLKVYKGTTLVETITSKSKTESY